MELVEIATDEQARRERFFGSPTIRIDGEDVIPPAKGDPVGLSCRLYRLRGRAAVAHTGCGGPRSRAEARLCGSVTAPQT